MSFKAVANFDRLTRRVCLTGHIRTVSALRIGKGREDDGMGASDLPVLVDAQGFPFLPGGSIKGVIRATAESLVRSVSQGEGSRLWSCDPHDERAQGGACGYHTQNDRERAKQAVENSCTLCRLFGSRMVASHVRFTDALLERPTDGRPPIERRDGVAIDRDLGIAFGPQKYDFEVVSPGARFKLEVFIDNPEDALLGLLVLAFDQLDDGFSGLGGFTTRGLGRVAIDWHKLTDLDVARLFADPEAQADETDAATLRTRFNTWRAALARLYQETR